MISKGTVESIVNQHINTDNEFVVEISVSSSNKIIVLIDSDDGITIDRCVLVSKAIEQSFDRDEEDFELEVSSAGLSSPLKVVRQYQKNIGRNLDVVLANGTKMQGKLLSATESSFSIEVQEKVVLEGKKRKELITKSIDLPYSDIKTAYKIGRASCRERV